MPRRRQPAQALCNGLFFAEARPEELTPHVMVLLAQHLARHRLREPQLLETIAHFLVVQEAQLSSKVGLPPTILFCLAATTPLGSAVSGAIFLCGTLS